MDPSELPFANVRQRGYAHKLDVVAGHGPALGSTAAIALQKTVSNPPAGQLPNNSASGQAAQQSSNMQTAIDELETLKVQLSGVEAAVTLIKTYGPSVPGRSSPSHGRRAVQQLAASQSNTTNSISPRAGTGSPNHRLQLHQQKPAVAGGKLAAPKPAAAAASPFAGTPVASARAGHSSSPIGNSTGRSSPASPAKAGVSTVGGSGRGMSPVSKAQHSSMTESDMQAVIQDPVNQLLRQSHNILGFSQSQQTAAAAVQPGSSTSTVPIVPVSRNEALQLEDRVQEALPPGAIFATQQQHTAAWAKQQQRHWKQQLAVQPEVLQRYQQVLAEQQQQQQQGSSWQQCDILSVQLIPMHQVMDALLHETAQQVAYHCVEHGRIVDNLRERYAELANALYLSITSPSHQLTSVSAALSAAVAAATAAQRSTAALEHQLTAKQAEAEDMRSNVTTWQLKHDQLVTESQDQIQQVSQQVLDLRRQLWQLRDDRESDQVAADRAAAAVSEEAEGKLAAAEETSSNLRQRVAFLQAQLQAIREQQRPAVATSHQESQTDPPEPPPTAEETEPPLEPESSSASEIEQEYEQPVKKKRRKVLDLLKYAKRGQVRSQLWVVKVVGQLYADKAVADAAADAQGQGRGGVAEFIMNWHMNRYGLRHMALEALSDLLASTCYYAAAGNRPAYWFAHFCDIAAAIPKTQLEEDNEEEDEGIEQDKGLGEVHDLQLGQLDPADLAAAAAADNADLRQQQQVLTEIYPPRSEISAAASPAAAELDVKIDLQLLLATPAALDFYLFCCCQLAYPNSVVALFPEGEDALPLVRSSLVMESLKAVFRYLGDPDGQALFVARKLDLAAAATSSPGAAAAVDITVGRSAASASSTKGLLPGRSSPTAAAAAAARSNLASGSSSSSVGDLQPLRELMSKKPLNLRAVATAVAGGSSSGGSSRDRGGSMTGGSSSTLVGGFGYYSAWALLDLFMSEWVDRVVVNAAQVAEVRRTVTAMQPPLQAQLTTAAAAAASRPLLFSKLQESKAALDLLLKPPLEAAAAAAALARSRKRRSSSDSDHQPEDSPAAAAGSSSRAQQRRSELQPHLLVADGTMVNAAAAWGAYQALVSCMQAIHERAMRPQSTPGTTPQAAAAAPHNDFDLTPVAVEAAAAEIAAAHQGVVLSDALQQQLRELGLAPAASSAAAADNASMNTAAAAAAAAIVSPAVLQDVLKPGGMASALQAARAKRAAAAALGASRSGGASASGGMSS